MKTIASVKLKKGKELKLTYSRKRIYITSGDIVLFDELSSEMPMRTALNIFEEHVAGHKLLNLIDEKTESFVKPLGYVSIQLTKESKDEIFELVNLIDNPFDKDGYHFTLFYDVNFDKNVVGELDKNTKLKAKPIDIEILAGNTENAALAIVFESEDLMTRFEQLKNNVGFVSDYGDLKPHVTVKYISKDKSIPIEERMKELQDDLVKLKDANILNQIGAISMEDEQWRLTRNYF